MPNFEVILFGGIALVIGVGGLMLWVALRESQPTEAAQALDEGRFAAAAELANTGENASDRDLRVAAIAAKHLADWNLATTLLDRLLREDPEDAEALLEKGLVLTYCGDTEQAIKLFDRALAIRSDLSESLNLHSAYALSCSGEIDKARKIFEEIEVPLETKLRSDMGSGEPVFCEWFLHAAAMWVLTEDWKKASWARDEGQQSAGDSRLPSLLSKA